MNVRSIKYAHCSIIYKSEINSRILKVTWAEFWKKSNSIDANILCPCL